MKTSLLRLSSLAAAGVLTAACATDSPLTAPTADLRRSTVASVVSDIPQIVQLCKIGPAGTSATFNISATGGILQHGTTTTLAATTIDNPDGCIAIWRSVDPQPNPDVIHTVTVTEVGQTGGTVLERVVSFSQLDGWTEEFPPVNSASVRVNYANGATIWFKNIDGPDDGGAAGCTPGFWRQDQHISYWTGFDPSDLYADVFGVDRAGTLLENVAANGGGADALARHSVAALLNATNSEVDYDLTVAQIIAGVQAAYASGDFESFKNVLEGFNEQGCSVDKSN